MWCLEEKKHFGSYWNSLSQIDELRRGWGIDSFKQIYSRYSVTCAQGENVVRLEYLQEPVDLLKDGSQ